MMQPIVHNRGVTDQWVIDLARMEHEGTLMHYLERVLRHQVEPSHQLPSEPADR